jgi:RhtB (resistance to homoserine/threonine) family protein
MEELIGLWLAYVVFMGALVSPGPDFLIVLKNTLSYSTKAGVFSAIGIAAGLIFHISYCLAGIGFLISSSLILFSLIKIIGALYLIFVGIKALRSSGTSYEMLRRKTLGQDIQSLQISNKEAFYNGLITNVFNPKATMFFIALFSQMIDPATAFSVQFLFSIVCLLSALLWFCLVAVLLGHRAIRRRYAQLSKWIDRVFGLFFIGLGLKLSLVQFNS